MIFISYKNTPDYNNAMDVLNLLEGRGKKCWMAPRDISVGLNFHKEVPSAINRCEAFVVIISEATFMSEHTEMEVFFAKRYGKKIIVLVQGDTAIQDSWLLLLGESKIIRFDERIDDKIADEICSNIDDSEFFVTVNENQGRRFILLKNDFTNNMKKVISENSDVSRTVFATGLDISGDLGDSVRKGILAYLVPFLEKEYGIKQSELQRKIDEARGISSPEDRTPMEYGDTVLIKIPTGGKITNLLLIGNSSNINGDSKPISLIDQREVIMRIFDKVKSLGEENNTGYDLFLGAIGTGESMKYPYEVITTEVLNCFSYANINGTSPFNVYYSVREADMNITNRNWDDIYSYISDVMDFVIK